MRGLYLAEGAMLVQQAQLQVISNNMANLRTTGFKRDQAVETSFAEWMLHELRPAHEVARGSLLRPIGSAAHNVATQETVTNFNQGPLEVTDRRLDFALFGEGFFQVQGDDEILLTRNGRFTLNAEGFLVNADGFLVLGEAGPIELGTDEVDSKPDGTLYVDGQPVGRLQIAVPAPDALLEKVGDNYFRSEDAAGGDEDFQVISGFLEGSNVSLIREMTALMTVRRAYEAAQKIMITYDQILDKGVNELGSST